MFAKKSLGQNFLIDKNILSKIADALSREIPGHSRIVEIGPGRGALTNVLLELSPKELILVEKDLELASALKDRFKGQPEVNVLETDIRKVDWSEFKDFYLIANIPYYITGYVMEEMMRAQNRLYAGFLMVQKELSDKIREKNNAKKYSYLSVICQIFFDIIPLMNVSRNSFAPVPNVDSVFLGFFPKKLEPISYDSAERFLRACFFARRKSLLNNLTRVYNKSSIIELFEAFGLKANIRPQELSPQEYLKLICFMRDKEGE